MTLSILKFSEIQSFKGPLSEFWDPMRERCGTITSEGTLRESTNLAPDPLNDFLFPEGDLEIAKASWHTHTYGDANLSLADYWFFKSWPNLVHFVIYKGDVRCYLYLDDTLHYIAHENDIPARISR